MTADKQIPDIDLERFALGELETARAKDIQKRLEEDPKEAERLAALSSSDEEILSAYPPHQMAVAIQERLRGAEESSRKKTIWIAAPIVVATMAVLSFFAIFNFAKRSHDVARNPEVILTKGDAQPSLIVYRHTARGEERLVPNSIVSAGDVVQLRYAAKGARHGVIFSVDGRGTLTLHFPSEARSSTTLRNRGTHSLSFSYELDDAPKFERFFFVTSPEPIDIEAVLKAGRSLGPSDAKPLALPPGLTQLDFLLRKNSK